jgi:starvation-inducible DNA-binding protein
MTNNSAITQGLQSILNSLIQSCYLYKDLHWNFEGENFYEYHNLFDAHANSSIDPQDTIAERIRQLDTKVNVDVVVKDSSGLEINRKNLPQILGHLLKTHESIIVSMQKTIDIASDSKDFSTADMLTGYLESQQKMLWFIRSSSR